VTWDASNIYFGLTRRSFNSGADLLVYVDVSSGGADSTMPRYASGIRALFKATGGIFYPDYCMLMDHNSSYGLYKGINTFGRDSWTSTTFSGRVSHVDVGNIEIKYIYPPVDYEAKIDVSIEMIGQNLTGKTYLDYFNIVWENQSFQVNFTMELKSDINQLEVLSLIKNITIIITLNADIVFGISTTAIHGNIDLNVPFGVTIKNIESNNTYGKISYNFKFCTILGDIVGIDNEGDIEFKTYNVEYAQNCSLFLDTNTGDILVEIHQNKDIGANITGIIKNAENINIIYRDNSANIGALFLLHNANQFFTIWDQWVGFSYSSLEGGNGYIFQSFDFPTRYNYNLSFYKNNGEGRYHVDLISLPFS